ncbi:uncharacterized protein LOC118189316 isoform X2 [Stegodyphus dumicola]|uniref:uncharacterized protein LOC118189316 isoform X2 n=1 Tax=Stegodyphus dumicola TaxID=202533 RepID=UPI0015AE4441|nr:uncharacterized protein LOC118189316 isoform X2 [Stegodyphus dumicola]
MGSFKISGSFRCFWSHLFYGICFGLWLMHGYGAVEIRRLSVPRWVQNGTEDFVILDCEYSYTENDFRLVVKWFFEDNLEPVYQWIPELDRRHTSGVLHNRLDLDFAVNTVDAYSKFRALRIPKPSTELSGKYTCVVASLANQDSREQVMTVFVPANEFELGYFETSYNTVNVSCEALGVFPSPDLRLYLRPTNGSPPQLVTNVKTESINRSSGAFDAFLHRTFKISELTVKGATVFECVLELPGTNYVKSKRIAYFPGSPDGWSSSTSRLHLQIGYLELFIINLIVTQQLVMFQWNT